MHLTLAHIGSRPASSTRSKDGFDALTQFYLDRCSVFARCQMQAFRTEQDFLDWLAKQQGRAPAVAVLLDSRGRQMTSEAFAAWLGAHRDQGAQHIVFAIGPADGWSAAALEKAQLKLSLGTMTMAHALARLVVAEQIYRAFTILTSHPYHTGH
jgi:23S rRNA (pseudouridine1915-N3)-methyltransferase